MKNLLVATLVILGLATTSCTKSDEGLQSNQSETQSRRRPTGGGSGSTGENTGIPQPTGLTATASGSTQVNLAWNSVPNATSDWIYRGTYVPAIVTSTNYIDISLIPGATYTYAVAAVVSTVLGPKSASVTVTTPR